MMNKAFRLTALHNQARAHARVRPCICLYKQTFMHVDHWSGYVLRRDV